MKTLQTATFSLATSLLLIGCGGSSYSDRDEPTTNQPPVSSTNKNIQIKQKTTAYLTDASGMALYTFDKDTLNTANCTSSLILPNGKNCLQVWPTFVVTDGSSADLSFVDTSSHTAFRKHPLYYFAPDAIAGDKKGDWVNGIWHLVYAPTDFTATTEVTLSSQKNTHNYLADSQGMTLYTFDKDTANKSNCTTAPLPNGKPCLNVWPIAKLNTANLPTGTSTADFAEITRADGAKQTTYKTKPLYYFTPDAKAGDTKGDWVGGVWHLAELSPASLQQAPAKNPKIALGKTRFEMGCNVAACHGPEGKNKALGVSRIIADIHDAGTVKSLLEYMKNDGAGKGATMVNIAKSLSQEEIDNLSAYVGSL